jgi:hypothetical protein
MILDDSCKDALGQMKVTKVDDTSITLDGHVVIHLSDNDMESILSMYKKKEYPEYVVPIMYRDKPYDIKFTPKESDDGIIVICDDEYFFVAFNDEKNYIMVYETNDVSGNEKDGYSCSLTGYVIHQTTVYDEEIV